MFYKKPEVTFPAVNEKNSSFLKKVHVQTWGCQMNVADTERMLSILGTCNYRPVDDENEADLILLNTCHIREKARHKVVSRLGELKFLKKEKPGLILAVAGCVAQAEAESLAKEVPFVDMIFGPDRIEELPQLLENVLLKQEQHDLASQSSDTDAHFITQMKKPFVDTKFDNKNIGYSIPIDVIPPYYDPEKEEISRFVNIIKGCNNFCTFCVVPFTRGREKSRTQDEILNEIKFLLDKNAKEIILLGQNVNSYGLDLLGAADTEASNGRMPFADLLYSVSSLEGVERIRFTTSNPHDFTPALAQAFADLPKVTNSFHLPVQSGSNRILERMNRQYTREEYLEKAGWIRNVRPEMAFSTDIIVGFPGETDDEFEETLNLVKEMKYSFIYAFKYSPRKGTPATRFKDQVSEDVKDKRLQALLEFQRGETERQNKAEINKIRDVMILYKNKKEDNSWYGRTYEGRLVKVQTPRNLIGQTLPVLIKNANVTALDGHPA